MRWKKISWDEFDARLLACEPQPDEYRISCPRCAQKVPFDEALVEDGVCLSCGELLEVRVAGLLP